MADALILDASPLIFLSRVDLLHLLPRLANTLQVPASVVAEVKAGEATDPVVASVGTWAEGYLGRDVPVPLSVAAWELGAGESQVIAAACGVPGSEVALDDLAARRCALPHGPHVVGTLGLLLRGRQRGFIPAVRSILQRLLDSGMYLEPTLAESVLAEVGE